MEQNHFFTGGLHQDTDPQFQPPDTYRDAENMVLTAGGHLAQELSERILATGLSFPPVGATTLNNQDILFSTDGNFSEIGVLDGDIYTPILTSNLFSLGQYVSATAKTDYRGHRIVYWADGASLRWLDLDSPTTNIPKGLDAIANPSAPVVTLESVQAGGELPTGVYQATACLLTASKNEASYGLFTGVIPVTNEDPTTASRQALDGAPPQTAAAGSITFKLENLDPSYAYVQLVVATYTGSSNSLELHSLPLIPLNNRTSLSYTYYSFSQHQAATTLDAVLSSLPNYISAKSVLQKDGHLLAAGLRTQAEETTSWQAIANNIVLGPTTKELPFSESVHIVHYREDSTEGGVDDASLSYSKEDYKNPILTENGRGFTREEVYSFCFIPIVNGRRLDAYHIPAAPTGTSGAFAAYISLEEYPSNQGHYVAEGNFIRHHRMPSLQQEPLLSSNGNIRVLGVQELVKPDLSATNCDAYIIGMQKRSGADRSIVAQGIMNPLIAARENVAYYVSPFAGQMNFGGGNNDAQQSSRMSREYAAFYSPETSILAENTPAATSIKQVAVLSGTSYGVADKRTGGLGEEFAAVFLDYKKADSVLRDSVPLLSPSVATILPQDGVTPATLLSGERYPIMTSGQNGYTLLKADLGTSPGFALQGVADIAYTYNDPNTSAVRFRQGDGSFPNGDDAQWTGVTQRPLYNLIATRSRQYGSLEQAIYFPIASLSRDSLPAPIFNGDTFIGKVALISATQELTDEDPGLRFTTLSYFFSESSMNVNYRHYVSSATLNTLPYYPKVRNLWQKDGSGVMQYPTGNGQANGYNKQYSFVNNLVPFFPKDYSITPVTDYSNRILYSALAVEGEQVDAYRLFKPNDYHDIPKEHGPITSLFTLGNTLYTHTTGATYKSFFNERAAISTTEGEVSLGNGGLFPSPSMPIQVVREGGWAGSQDPRAAITTNFGHFFVDRNLGKVFLLSDNLKEIKEGLYNYLNSTIKNGSNYRAAYDYAQERFILSADNFRTLSWSARSQKWVSFHDYSPLFTYGTTSHHVTYTEFLSLAGEGAPLQSSVTTITNLEPDASKANGNVELHSSSLASSLTFGTQTQQSGSYTPILYDTFGQETSPGELFCRIANHQYQMKIPRDVVGGRLKGKWMSLQTVFKKETLPTLLKQLTIKFRASYR